MGVVKIVDLRIKEWKGQQKLIEMTPIFPSQLSFNCVPIELKCIAYQLYSFTYDIKHVQQYIGTWQHIKWTFNIRVGPKYLCIYVWTYDTYTKVLGCKTWNNWPPMRTWIIKIAIDVAQTSHLTSLQV